jgi:NDP-sugar pyrophosphorylase family protein
MVKVALGDGSPWGVSVTYVDEGEALLGTGGAVRLAVEHGAVEDEFFVLYGDSYLSLELEAVDQRFHAAGTDALMTVYHNRDRWDKSNAVFSDGMVTHYEKGLAHPPPDMQFVDYGLSALRASVVRETVPPTTPSDLADAFAMLSVAGRLAGFEASERFFEVGTPSGLADLERVLAGSADEAHRRR